MALADAGRTLLLENHVLVGKILNVHEDRFVTPEDLFQRMRGGGYVLIGEVHDNPLHHEIQQRFVDALRDMPGDVSVSFEMIDYQQGEAVTRRQFSSAAELIDTLAEFESGWPYEKHYAGVFETVIDAGFEIRDANIPRPILLKVMRDEQALPEQIVQLIEDVKFGEQARASLKAEIAESHCDMLPAANIPPMVYGQQARDAAMALSLTGSSARTAVLIAGNGHIRNDRGVPRYLQRENQDASYVTIAIMEVEEDLQDPYRYSEAWRTKRLPFDYVWFTPRAERTDPCEDMKKHMEEISTLPFDRPWFLDKPFGQFCPGYCKFNPIATTTKEYSDYE